MAHRAVRASAKASALLAPRRSLLHTCIITLASLVSLIRRPAAVPPCRRRAVPAVPEERRGEGRGERRPRGRRVRACAPSRGRRCHLVSSSRGMTSHRSRHRHRRHNRLRRRRRCGPRHRCRAREATRTRRAAAVAAPCAREGGSAVVRAPGVGGRWVVGGGWCPVCHASVAAKRRPVRPSPVGRSPPRAAQHALLPSPVTRCCLPRVRDRAVSTSGLEVDGRR